MKNLTKKDIPLLALAAVALVLLIVGKVADNFWVACLGILALCIPAVSALINGVRRYRTAPSRALMLDILRIGVVILMVFALMLNHVTASSLISSIIMLVLCAALLVITLLQSKN